MVGTETGRPENFRADEPEERRSLSTLDPIAAAFLAVFFVCALAAGVLYARAFGEGAGHGRGWQGFWVAVLVLAAFGSLLLAALRLTRTGVHRHLAMGIFGVLVAATGVGHWMAQEQARSPETRAGVVVVIVWVLGGLAVVVISLVPARDRTTQRRNGAVLLGVAVVMPVAMLLASRPIGVLPFGYPTNTLSPEPKGNAWPLDLASVVVGAVGGVWLGLAHRRTPPRPRPNFIVAGVVLAVVVPAVLFVADFVAAFEPARCWEWSDRPHTFAGGSCFAYDIGFQLATLAAIGGGVLLGLGATRGAGAGGPQAGVTRPGGPVEGVPNGT